MDDVDRHVRPAAYMEQLQAFRKSDGKRDEMVEEIIQNYEQLQLRYAEKCDDYNNEVESRRLWQSKAKASEVALVEQRQASGSNPFALAVIDGDGAIFQDYLYAMGKDGGADACHQLHTELKNHLKALYPDGNVSDWNIVVQVILNLQGLAGTLQACGIITSLNELSAFGRAFGLSQPLFSFVDVGSGKERADHKIRETLRLFLPVPQCKHVFFGPCNDNGYLPVLEPYKRDQAVASRLTLIETRPAEPGFVELGFRRIRFPSIFRSDNLPSARAAGPLHPLISTGPMRPDISPNGYAAVSPHPRAEKEMRANSIPFIPTSTSPAPSTDSAASSTWAMVGKTGGAPTKNINISAKKTQPRKHALVNAYDDRLDPVLPRTDTAAEFRFSERVRNKKNLCNNYHLTGKCEAGEWCDYHHGERLSPGETLVLRHKARSLHCVSRYACRDVNCYLGHHCKFGNACPLEICKFADTHNIDMEPAKRVYEDGTEEWIQAYLDKARP